jgi:hypothetical protein
MSVASKTAQSAVISEAVASLQADNAELRSQLAAFIAASTAHVAALSAPRTRTARVQSAPATVSEVDRVLAEGGFRRGYRGKVVRALIARGPGDYALADIAAEATPGYEVRALLPVCGSISRRFVRRPLCGYTLIVDIDESDAGKTVLVLARRTASDPVDTSPEGAEDAE